jgi:hypothetical protein
MAAKAGARGKYEQWGAGSRSRSQARAEDKARKSRKLAEKRAAFKREERA